MRCLLLLVDFQEDFLSRPGLHPCAGEVVDQAAGLLKHWRETGNPVAHIRMTISTEGEDKLPHWRRPGREACIVGTAGHEVPKALQELDNETILHKTGYSASGLINLVEEAGVESVVVAGLLLHACVRQAVIELFERGVRVVVAADAVASDDPVHAAVTRRYFEDRSLPFMASESIINNNNLGCHASFTPHSTDLLNATIERAAAFARSWSRSPFSEKSALVTRFARNLG
ncbi:MAG: isochorismatase family cysteine hydrolase, partial [Verrucomicrobiales bacterium]